MRTLSILSVVCAFALTACGGGDGGSTPVTTTPTNETAGNTTNPGKSPVSVVQNPAGAWIRSEISSVEEYGLIAPNGDFLLARQLDNFHGQLFTIASNLNIDQHNALQINGSVHGDMRALLGYEDAKLSGTVKGDSLSAEFAQPKSPSNNFAFDLKRYAPAHPQVVQGLTAVKGSYANVLMGSRQPVAFSIDDKGVLNGTIGLASSTLVSGKCSLQGQLTPYDASTPNFYKVRLEVHRPLIDGSCSATTSIQTGYAALLEPKALSNYDYWPRLVVIVSNDQNESTAVTPDKEN
ncbi:hypothetical protein [Burkholderia cepacia]|uniref:hypothetical protein n=1 Tax=Burkholderia cepacia TaxID=292 RepID=UPI000AFF3A2F|nr:hypothetical protein [Burkholderia cepacia]